MPIEILMPTLDPSMTEARVVVWLKQEGDVVETGETLVEIETDKAIFEVAAESSGVFGKAIVATGDNANVNTVIGLLLGDGETLADLESYPSSPLDGKGEIFTADSDVIENEDTVQGRVDTVQGERLFASPLARRIASQQGIELATLKGSGPNGRIIKRDVESTIQQAEVRTQSPTVVAGRPGDEVLSLSPMRKTIAKRLSESSQQIPHYYLTVDCNLDQLLLQRKELNKTFAEDARLSVTDFIVKAVSHAMKKVPNVNVRWDEKAIIRFSHVDISVAVAVDGGLITPVIRDVDSKTLSEISRNIKQLASKAKQGKLLPQEYQGGTFTISNLGMHGIKHFTSIINPPQAGILSVGAAEQRPIIVDGDFKVATMMTVTLGADHRCVDGAVGAEFLGSFKGFIEAPITMFVTEG